MKQHISVEQLSSLDFARQKAIATLFGQYGNCVRNDNDGNEYFNLGILAERINIGKMLDIVTQNHSVKALYQECVISNEPDYGLQWHLELFYDIDVPLIVEDGEELCNVLWEVTKKVAYI